jgi:hypothetical protein
MPAIAALVFLAVLAVAVACWVISNGDRSGRDVPYWSDNGPYARNASWHVLAAGRRAGSGSCAGPARRLC